MAKTQTGNWCGKTIAAGRFEVMTLLGEGGMGQAYRARDRKYERDVVIKVPHLVLLRDPEFAKRFEREIESLRQLVHPHIVPVLCGGLHSGIPFVVLRYMPDGSLAEKIESSSLGERLALLQDWLPQIADALDFVHESGFIHRDVKPDNIFFDDQGQAYLGDFGIVKAASEATDSREGTRLTMTGTVIGTPEYMAPEMAMGEDYNHRSDQYSLAVTAYESLDGEPPFQGPTPAAILVRLTTTDVPNLSSKHSSIPTGLSDAVSRGLSKEPEDRFDSCSEFASAVTHPDDSAEGGSAADDPAAKITSWQERKSTAAFSTTAPHDIRRTTRRSKSKKQPLLDPETPFAPLINPLLVRFRRLRKRYGLRPIVISLVSLMTVTGAAFYFSFGTQTDDDLAEHEPEPELTLPYSGTKPVGRAQQPLGPQGQTGGTTSVASNLVKKPLAKLPVNVLPPIIRDLPLSSNSIGMKFKPIIGGTFTKGEDDEAHQVTLTQPFELGVYEVTQEQYEGVMGTNPSRFTGRQNPVDRVSWDDAVEFCRKLSALPAEKKAGYVYRLPTEAEWEYSCRAGTQTTYSFGDSESELGEYAWYYDNSERTTHPVGGKKPNPWGLYDMHGNVWEWCSDRYGNYPSGSVTDPTGATSGSYRVIRGGSWSDTSQYARSAGRNRSSPDNRYNNMGFRVLRSSVGSSVATVATPIKPTTPPISVVRSGTRAGEEQSDNSLKMKLVWCPPGKFTMGSPASESGRRSNEDQVAVTLTQGFWLGKCEVTQREWRDVMGSEPWKGQRNVKKGDQIAATYVSWSDAVAFCGKLTASERVSGQLSADWEYTLPTEAQWEYACRSGTLTAYGFRDSASALKEYGWFSQNASSAGEQYAREVGLKLPNGWNLHDMHGNVFEWCRDSYSEKLPGGTDPRGPSSGSNRVYRGGSWGSSARHARSADRYWLSPDSRYSLMGFRVLRSSVLSGK